MNRKTSEEQQVGKKDSYTKAFTSRNDVFADLFNNFIFKGKKVVDPDKLVERDTTELAMDAEKNDSNAKIQRRIESSNYQNRRHCKLYLTRY
jgi:hypothetical protein